MYMRLHTDSEINSIASVEILSVLNRAQVTFDTDADDDQLRVLLKKLERTRTLGIWHDHSTLLGVGYVLITVKIIYDTAVFKTQHEIEDEEEHRCAESCRAP